MTTDDDNITIKRFDDGSSMQVFEDGTSLITDSSGNISANSGTTTNGKTGSMNYNTFTGKRPKNPLADFPSYTYQLSLYMVTPDAYIEFVVSGRNNINSLLSSSNNNGAFLVAQSGGINKETKRAPGFELDYYLDNLVINSKTSGKSTGGAFLASDFSFNIYEPYGFSLIKNLKKAMDQFQRYSKLKNIDKISSAVRNFFILGIRFLGYDNDGNLIQSTNTTLNGTKVNDTGLIERFYDIIITEMKFKIDGRATTYFCKAANAATQTGFGVKFGRLRNDITVTAGTVEEALLGNNALTSGLLTQLNQQQNDMYTAGNIEIPNVYDVVFLGDTSQSIAASSIFNKKADPDKTKLPIGNIKTSDQVSESTSVKVKPNSNLRNLAFKSDTSILQCIQLIISQSSYIEDALKQIYTTEAETNRKTDSPDEVVPNNKKTLTYYNVSSQIEVLDYDTYIKDFAYRITYIIEPYMIPYLQAVGSNLTTPYYGPAKRYDYWLTGKNTEIIRYEQSFNNLYAIAGPGGSPDSLVDTGVDSVTPIIPYLRSDSPRQGKSGRGADAQNGITTFLNDPRSLAEAEITILGDPDFLTYPNSDRYNPIYDPFYNSSGYTINPNGGQVFIEIDFKEAVDYDNKTGVMSINDRILFFEYPDSIKKVVKGIVYMVITVKSEFKNGKFEQVLKLQMPQFPIAPNKNSTTNGRNNNSAVNNSRTTNSQGGINQDNPTGSKTVGLKTDSVISNDPSSQQQTSMVPDQSRGYQVGNNQVTIIHNGKSVADDDATNISDAMIVSRISSAKTSEDNVRTR